jgi:hypothetical protein
MRNWRTGSGKPYERKKVEEKKMFGGMCFMVNGKMCICIRNEILCRIGPII